MGGYTYHHTVDKEEKPLYLIKEGLPFTSNVCGLTIFHNPNHKGKFLCFSNVFFFLIWDIQ